MNAVSAYFSEMQPPEIIAWICGTLGILMSVLLYAGRTRSHILIFKLISDVLWVINYLLLGAYTGAVLNFIGVFRESVFFNRDRRKWASHRIWLYVFLSLTLLSPTLEFLKIGGFSWIPLLPAVGSMLAVISFYSRRPQVMRYFGIAAQSLWILYSALVWNPTAFISSVLVFVSIVIGMIREAMAKRGASSKKEAAGETERE